MSNYEWNGGCCPHDLFTEDEFMRVCLDCGEMEAVEPSHVKDPHAQALGSKGGKARAASLSTEQQQAIARQGGLAQWADYSTEERSAIMKARAKKRKKG